MTDRDINMDVNVFTDRQDDSNYSDVSVLVSFSTC